MATITINIPVDKEDWVLHGLGVRFDYQDQVDNPDFDPDLPEEGDNTLMIPNPESKEAFAKRMIIHMIKDYANQGHNDDSFRANATIADTVTLT